MADGPGTPLEKLYAFRRSHFELGREYNEAELRKHLGLPAVPNPEFLPMTPERRRLVLMDDQNAKREAKEAEARAKQALEEERKAQIIGTMKDDRIQSLEAQIAELEAALAGANITVAASAATAPVGDVPDGEPNPNWTMAQIKAAIEAEGLPPLPRNGTGVSKMAALEHYAAAKKAKEEAAIGGE